VLAKFACTFCQHESYGVFDGQATKIVAETILAVSRDQENGNLYAAIK